MNYLQRKKQFLTSQIKQGVLPFGYKEVQYLESTGTQYIDTGIYLSLDSGCEIDANISFVHSSMPLGCDRIRRYNRLGFAIFIWEGKRICTDIINNNTQSIPGWTNSLNERHLYKHDKNNSYLDNKVVFSNIVTEKSITYYSIKIFKNIDGGFTAGSKCKIYYAKLFDNESNMIWNGIPCIDNNNKPCMYDTVSKKTFYNQGTGEFLYGEVIN